MRGGIARIVAFVAMAGTAAAADLSGTWSGTWTKNGDPLNVTANFTVDSKGLSGAFDSDALQVAGIPLRDVRQDGAKVHFTLTGDASTAIFDGTLNGNAVDGTFAEGDTKGTFHMERAAATPAVTSHDVTFASGAVTIAGTIIEPKGSGLHPAIVFLHGSGPEGRWANRWLAQRFAEAGFAALITDKRGVGGSTGHWQDAGFEDLADDAAAGLRFLGSQPGVDAKRIGIYGHSQGGTIAPLVYVKAPTVAFVIAAAPGGIDPATLEEYSVGNLIGLPVLTPAEAADAKLFVKTIVDVAYRGHPRSELDAVAARFKGRNWYFDPPPADNYYWRFAARIASFKPDDTWRQVKVPVLLLYGELDQRVPKEAIGMIAKALHSGGNDNYAVAIIANADHAFAVPDGRYTWPRHVQDYAEMLINWAKNPGVPPPPH